MTTNLACIYYDVLLWIKKKTKEKMKEFNKWYVACEAHANLKKGLKKRGWFVTGEKYRQHGKIFKEGKTSYIIGSKYFKYKVSFLVFVARQTISGYSFKIIRLSRSHNCDSCTIAISKSFAS